MGQEYLPSTSLKLTLTSAGDDPDVEARKKEEIAGCRKGPIPLIFQQYIVKSSVKDGHVESSCLFRFKGGGETESPIDLLAAIEVVLRKSWPRRSFGTRTDGLCRYLWLFLSPKLGCRDADRVSARPNEKSGPRKHGSSGGKEQTTERTGHRTSEWRRRFPNDDALMQGMDGRLFWVKSFAPREARNGLGLNFFCWKAESDMLEKRHSSAQK